jgi:hypothetical protein
MTHYDTHPDSPHLVLPEVNNDVLTGGGGLLEEHRVAVRVVLHTEAALTQHFHILRKAVLLLRVGQSLLRLVEVFVDGNIELLQAARSCEVLFCG